MTKGFSKVLTLSLPALVLEGQAMACAVCGAGANDPTGPAYNYSTAMLSFVPLIAMGAIAYGIYRYINRENERI